VREAEVWLFDDDRRWPFSFVNICDAFDLSPPAVRVALLAGGAHASGGEGRPLSGLRVRTSPRRPRRMLTRHAPDEAQATSSGGVGRHLAAATSSR
jgi:hypothetical protein